MHGPRRATREVFERGTMQKGDALDLLASLPDACSPLAFFDPQFRAVLDKLAYGNEGAKQKARFDLPAMREEYIDACLRRIALALRPSGYCVLWADTFNLCEGHHRRVKMPLSASTVSLGTIFVPATAIVDGARATICWCYRKNHYVQRLHGATTASDVAGMRRSTRSFTHIHTPSRSV
jgi:hypothetical protein